MPLYDKQCLNGHRQTIYAHTPVERYCRTVFCPICGEGMGSVLSLGQGLTYFSEKRAQVIHNMGHEPVVITSEKQHRDEMKKRGIALAGTRRGEKGCWV